MRRTLEAAFEDAVERYAETLAAEIGNGEKTIVQLGPADRAACYARAEQAIAAEWAERDEGAREMARYARSPRY